MRDAPPIELTAKALAEAASRYASSAPEPPAIPPHLDEERARYLEEARRLAAELETRHPEYQKGTGDPEIDRLIWFRFVHCSLGYFCVTPVRTRSRPVWSRSCRALAWTCA